MANWIQNTLNWVRGIPTVTVDTHGIPFPDWADFVPVGGNEIAYVELNNSSNYKDAVDKCAPLAAIIMLCADAFSNGNFEVLNRSTQNYTRGKYKEWDELLNRPNRNANKSTFLKQLYANVITNGYCYAIPLYPSGFKDRPSEIILLPPEILTIELKDPKRLPHTYGKGESMRRVFLNYGGLKTELKEEDLILFTDNSPHIDPKTWLPQSRLRTLRIPASIYAASENVTLTQTVKHGPTGIISPDNTKDVAGSLPFKPGEKDQLQLDLRKYGTLGHQLQHIISNQALKYTEIGSSLQSLMLTENELKSIKAMCFVLGFPIELTPFSDQSTYENKRTAGKDLYQGTIIPQAANLIEQLNEGLKTHEQNIEIKPTYEDVYVFQQSQQEKGEGVKAMSEALILQYKNNLITLNRVLELLGEDTIPGADYYYKDSPEFAQQMEVQKMRFNKQPVKKEGNGADDN